MGEENQHVPRSVKETSIDMLTFRDTYKNLIGKNMDRAIVGNPILALMDGVPAKRVSDVLMAAGWPESDVVDLLNQVNNSKI